MAGPDAAGDAGARSQVVDQPKAPADEHENEDGGSDVLLHAPAVFLILEVSHGIAPWILGRRRAPPRREGKDLTFLSRGRRSWPGVRQGVWLALRRHKPPPVIPRLLDIRSWQPSASATRALPDIATADRGRCRSRVW